MQHFTFLCVHRRDGEKTGDKVIHFSRLRAAKYFAKKKKISLRDWLTIYTVVKAECKVTCIADIQSRIRSI
jgi:predicted nucleic acid-binding protein